MVHTELIDVALDTQRRRRLRRRLLRIVVPVTCVIVMLGAILAIAMYSYHRNRRDALALSDDLLRLLHRRIATEVKDYLAPAADMARLAAGVLQDQAFGTAFPLSPQRCPCKSSKLIPSWPWSILPTPRAIF